MTIGVVESVRDNVDLSSELKNCVSRSWEYHLSLPWVTAREDRERERIIDSGTSATKACFKDRNMSLPWVTMTEERERERIIDIFYSGSSEIY